jgi:hypothetical protein
LRVYLPIHIRVGAFRLYHLHSEKAIPESNNLPPVIVDTDKVYGGVDNFQVMLKYIRLTD